MFHLLWFLNIWGVCLELNIWHSIYKNRELQTIDAYYVQCAICISPRFQLEVSYIKGPFFPFKDAQNPTLKQMCLFYISFPKTKTLIHNGHLLFFSGPPVVVECDFFVASFGSINAVDMVSHHYFAISVGDITSSYAG